LSICEGDFTPNATSPGAGRNVTECHKGFTNGMSYFMANNPRGSSLTLICRI
jgi:hypothetical protein